jgi:hypothetical protein
MGGHIERLLGTLMGALHELPGATFSSPQQRGNYDSDATAVMTLREIERWLTEYIVGVYHAKQHRGIQTSLQRWKLTGHLPAPNPVLRGWVGGLLWKILPVPALTPMFGHFNKTLVAWAMKKYKRLKRHKTRAATFLETNRGNAAWSLRALAARY